MLTIQSSGKDRVLQTTLRRQTQGQGLERRGHWISPGRKYVPPNSATVSSEILMLKTVIVATVT